VSNYYLGDVIDDDEVAVVQSAAEKLNVDVLNTRWVIHSVSCCSCLAAVFSVMKNGPNDYTLRVASATETASITHETGAQGKKANVTLEYGDFSSALQGVNEALGEVIEAGVIRYLFSLLMFPGQEICCKRTPDQDDRGIYSIVGGLSDPYLQSLLIWQDLRRAPFKPTRMLQRNG